MTTSARPPLFSPRSSASAPGIGRQSWLLGLVLVGCQRLGSLTLPSVMMANHFKKTPQALAFIDVPTHLVGVLALVSEKDGSLKGPLKHFAKGHKPRIHVHYVGGGACMHLFHHHYASLFPSLGSHTSKDAMHRVLGGKPGDGGHMERPGFVPAPGTVSDGAGFVPTSSPFQTSPSALAPHHQPSIPEFRRSLPKSKWKLQTFIRGRESRTSRFPQRRIINGQEGNSATKLSVVSPSIYIMSAPDGRLLLLGIPADSGPTVTDLSSQAPSFRAPGCLDRADSTSPSLDLSRHRREHRPSSRVQTQTLSPRGSRRPAPFPTPEQPRVCPRLPTPRRQPLLS